jgi:hypothetical protein
MMAMMGGGERTARGGSGDEEESPLAKMSPKKKAQ